MKKLLSIIIIFSLNNFAHNQHVHQYLTIEAYKLLKLHLGYDIPLMNNQLGGTTSFYVGDRSWQRGYITTGAWREDTDDVVYGYSKDNPPTITGLAGVLYQFIAAFGGATPDGFVSSTHFWYADNGDELATTINGAYDLGILGTHTFNFTIPNAYQKIQKYLNGNWTLHYNYGSTTGCPSSAFCMPASYPILGIAFRYDNLIEFFKTGKAYAKGFRGISGSWQYCDETLMYFGQEFRERISWEILGRMCHLLQDMSLPAHANIDPHGRNDGLRIDSYEHYFGDDYYWNANNVYSQIGTIINPYQSSKPLHYLMYTTNQIANHFGSNGPHMNQPNNSFGGNYLSEEISYLNSLNISQYGSPTTMTNPLTNQEILNVRDKMLPQAIRATAGLLYWFANECEIIPPPPPIPPIISHFTQNPSPMCTYSSTNVYVHLSQYTGTEQYTWNHDNSLPSGSYIVPHGNYCTVFLTTADSYGTEAPIKYVRCTVTNSAGTAERTHPLEINPGCTGCPTLSFNNAGQLTDENPLLITSLSNPGMDVTDFYLINSDVTPINNQIKFTIHEPQTEHSWIDNVELIETRIRENEYVAVTDDGEVVNYKKPRLPLRMMLNDTLDITGLLADLDGDMVSVKAGDYILVNLVTSTSKGESIEGGGDNIIMGGEEPGPPQKKIAGNIRFIKNSIESKESAEELVEDFGNFYFRPNLSIICKKLETLGRGNLQIEFTKDADIDYLVIARNLKTATVRELNMVEATHNLSGNLTSNLINADEIYGEILPGERIDFTFESGGNPGRKAYILKTTGRYETVEKYFNKPSGLENNNNNILEDALFENYPNPFNPLTQIKYSIKEDGMVILKVYNSIGEEVKVLVNEIKSAGIYEASFDATKLPSGVYFYSISARDFYETKKMLLIK